MLRNENRTLDEEDGDSGDAEPGLTQRSKGDPRPRMPVRWHALPCRDADDGAEHYLQNPTAGTKCRIISRKMHPPMPPTVHAMLIPRSRRVSTQCLMADMLGLENSKAKMLPMPNER